MNIQNTITRLSPIILWLAFIAPEVAASSVRDTEPYDIEHLWPAKVKLTALPKVTDANAAEYVFAAIDAKKAAKRHEKDKSTKGYAQTGHANPPAFEQPADKPAEDSPETFGSPSTSGSTWTTGVVNPGAPIVFTPFPTYEFVFTPTPSAVPVPAALWLLVSGLVGLGIVGRTRHRG